VLPVNPRGQGVNGSARAPDRHGTQI
jgi:hypothetical protein